MRISYNFYGDIKDDMLRIESSTINDYNEAESDPDTIRAFVSKLHEVRQQEKLQKIAEGRCTSVLQFKSLVDGALEIAERIGMDISADIQNETGIISLSVLHFDLHEKEEPELIAHLSKLISHADYQLFDTIEKYNEILVRFTFYYDLDLTSTNH